MYLLYSKEENDFEIYRRKVRHMPPHLTNALQCIFILEGSMALGVSEHLYEMKKGDLAVIFPNLIQHAQIFDENGCRAEFLLAAPSLAGPFLQMLEKQRPKTPVIYEKNVHPDIRYALETLEGRRKKKGPYDEVLHQAYLQIVLSRALPYLELADRAASESDDIVFRVVSYVAEHYAEPISLTTMAHDLYVSPYALSRIFSGTFHMNFNRYVNLTRLEYVRMLLTETDRSVTDIALDAGFSSQRTFNRVFREEFHMTPVDFRRRNAN